MSMIFNNATGIVKQVEGLNWLSRHSAEVGLILIYRVPSRSLSDEYIVRAHMKDTRTFLSDKLRGFELEWFLRRKKLAGIPLIKRWEDQNAA